MTILAAQLEILLASPPTWLRVADAGSLRSWEGTYVQINDRPFALGRLVGNGEEASVFDLIDLRSGEFDYVIKLCHYRPGSPEHERWAVPIRFQENAGSLLPTVETIPSYMVPFAGGGIAKVQRYVSQDPATDWISRLPIRHVQRSASGSSLADIRRAVEAMVARHGERGVLNEVMGRLQFANQELDAALESLTSAVSEYIGSGSSSRYTAALCLARVMEAIYRRDRSQGDLETSITLPGGTTLTNTFFSSSIDVARDDSLQDRCLFLLVEVMGELPYFVGGLEFIKECLESSFDRRISEILTTALRRVEASPSSQKGGSAGFRPQGSLNDDSPSPEARSDEVLPANVAQMLRAHEQAYSPEPPAIRAGAARHVAAIASLKRGNAEAAESGLKEAIELEPDVAEHRAALASLLVREGRGSEAVVVLEQAVSDMGGTPILRLLLGSVLLQLGRLEEAERVLLRARALLPDRATEISVLLFQLDQRRG